jgi:hypothetical protein
MVMEIIGIIAGIYFSYYLSKHVGKFIDRATKDVEFIPPKNIPKEKWESLIKLPFKDDSGKWIGTLERIISFLAFYLCGYVIIGAWLVFKVGSKWQVWNNLIQVPKEIKDIDGKDIDDFSYLRARQVWGSWLLTRFLIGTLLNIIIGFGLAYILQKITNKTC